MITISFVLALKVGQGLHCHYVEVVQCLHQTPNGHKQPFIRSHTF